MRIRGVWGRGGRRGNLSLGADSCSRSYGHPHTVLVIIGTLSQSLFIYDSLTFFLAFDILYIFFVYMENNTFIVNLYLT